MPAWRTAAIAILVLATTCLIAAYAYANFQRPDPFVREPDTLHVLLDPAAVDTVHGTPIRDPVVATLPTPLMDGDGAMLASVDGTPDAPRSMFTFAYNQCDPKCCSDQFGGYTCDRGCVCVTDEQLTMSGQKK